MMIHNIFRRLVNVSERNYIHFSVRQCDIIRAEKRCFEIPSLNCVSSSFDFIRIPERNFSSRCIYLLHSFSFSSDIFAICVEQKSSLSRLLNFLSAQALELHYCRRRSARRGARDGINHARDFSSFNIPPRRLAFRISSFRVASYFSVSVCATRVTQCRVSR